MTPLILLPGILMPAAPRYEALLAALGNAAAAVLKDLEVYRIALTHRSAAGIGFPADKPALESNERLEFLGDALLGTFAAEELFRRFPEEPEGVLTRRRSALVRTEQLAAWAQEIGLDDFMYLAPGERASVSGRDRILAGAYEALIGAIYLDRGGGPFSRCPRLELELVHPIRGLAAADRA